MIARFFGLLLKSFPLLLPLSPSRVIALRTEGYQSEDLSVLVDRAVRQSYFRLLQPKVDIFPSASKVSVATLVGESVPSHLPSQWNVTFEDFSTSLEGYVPAALRGLNVHLGKEAGFESVGGLEEAKQTLRETLLWPSKVETSCITALHMFYTSLPPPPPLSLSLLSVSPAVFSLSDQATHGSVTVRRSGHREDPASWCRGQGIRPQLRQHQGAFASPPTTGLQNPEVSCMSSSSIGSRGSEQVHRDE